MPGDPKECRENAKLCLEFAQTARTEVDRKRFEAFAQKWLVLATDLEAAKVLLEKWGCGPMTFSDDLVPRAHNPSAQRLSRGTPSSDQSPEIPCPMPKPSDDLSDENLHQGLATGKYEGRDALVAEEILRRRHEERARSDGYRLGFIGAWAAALGFGLD